MNRTADELVLESRVESERRTYRFTTADGVCSKDAFRSTELLIVDHLWGTELGDFLTLEANYGVCGIILSERADSIQMTTTSDRSAKLCRRNAAANGVAATVSLVADCTAVGGSFETVTYAPKAYTPLSVGQQRIANGLAALRPGGRLYLAASTQSGLTRYRNRLTDLAADVERVAKRDGDHLFRATRREFDDVPTFVSPRTITSDVDGVTLTLDTLPGLFSPTSLDEGTRRLLETVTVEDGDRVLDVCCGYGPIGIYAARTADCDVWLSDDDRVATRCAESSLRKTGVDGDATVVTADCVDGVAGQTFDRVLSNPPTHAGVDVLVELFDGVHDVLAPSGEFTLVHHRTLDLEPHLARFDSVERRATGEEHVVLTATR